MSPVFSPPVAGESRETTGDGVLSMVSAAAAALAGSVAGTTAPCSGAVATGEVVVPERPRLAKEEESSRFAVFPCAGGEVAGTTTASRGGAVARVVAESRTESI